MAEQRVSETGKKSGSSKTRVVAAWTTKGRIRAWRTELTSSICEKQLTSLKVFCFSPRTFMRTTATPLGVTSTSTCLMRRVSRKAVETTRPARRDAIMLAGAVG